jgi:glycosyltransferase involved in cell wall biosynthesis
MHSAPDTDLVATERLVSRRLLRLAMVTETYPPEINGVSLTIARMLQGLRDRQHAVQLVRPRQPGIDGPTAAPGEALMRGLPIPRYPHLRMGVPSTSALVSLWTRQRPDVVHIATEGPLGWSALRAALRLRLPVVSDFRTNFHTYSQHYGLGWLGKPIAAYLRNFHNRCLQTLVPTRAIRQELGSMGFQRLTVLPRGVDTQRFSPVWRSDHLRESWGAGKDTLVMLCVGRLAPEKNLGLLIDAFETLCRAGTDARLVLVGDGPLRKQLRERCPQAILAGMRTGTELAAHFASADLFVFPSLTETFGNVTTEALASALPVVAFRHAAAGELIQHGQSGLLADPERTDTLVQLSLLAGRNPALRQRLGCGARALALTLDWESIIDGFEDLLVQAAQHGSTLAPQGHWHTSPA